MHMSAIIRISWKEKPTDSCVHFFSPRFFTKLRETGVKEVSSWTSRRRVNVFSKKFIFFPVNENEHWSFCCVVNPGLVGNVARCADGGRRYHSDGDLEVPCLIILDPLETGGHDKPRIASWLRLWLNFEWKRVTKTTNDDFTSQSIPCYAPRGKRFNCLLYLF